MVGWNGWRSILYPRGYPVDTRKDTPGDTPGGYHKGYPKEYPSRYPRDSAGESPGTHSLGDPADDTPMVYPSVSHGVSPWYPLEVW